MSENNGASELIQRYLNGIATESEIADLNKLLTENPEVADAFVLATRHDSKLENYFNIEKRRDMTENIESSVTPAASKSAKSVSASRILARARRTRRQQFQSYYFAGGLVAAVCVVAVAVHFYNAAQLDKTRATRTATVIEIRGAATVQSGTATRPVQKGMLLAPLESLQTGSDGYVRLQYPDNTELFVQANTNLAILEITQTPDKALRLKSGVLSLDVAPQPADRPLTVATPHGVARVVGTVLKLAVELESTRLEVSKGKVRLANLEEKFVDVQAGQFAVVAAQTELVAKSINEPAKQVAPPTDRRDTIVWNDFEDGVRPDYLQDGVLVSGPERTGNKFSVQGKEKPNIYGGARFKNEIWIEKKSVNLFTYASGMQLEFDCWITVECRLDVGVWNETQKQSMSVEPNRIPPGRWNHISLPMDDLRVPSKPAIRFKAGDAIKAWFIAIPVLQPGTQKECLYIDNIKVTQPATAPHSDF